MIAYFDGACQPRNPGGAMGWGAAIYQGNPMQLEIRPPKLGELVYERACFRPAEGRNSNNVAEYLGATAAVKALIDRGARTALVIGDSKLVVEQMSGRWRMKGGHYLTTALELRAIIAESGIDVRWAWIPRHENGVADELSHRGLIKNGIPIVLGSAAKDWGS